MHLDSWRVGAAVDGPRSIALVVLAILAIHVVANFFMTPEVTTSEVFWILLGAGLGAMGPARAARDAT
jgi:hypothetical protein